MAVYVFVAGGGCGGFIWKQVALRLRGCRHDVFTPTLTGLGERVHLSSPSINLDTHIQDILGVLEYEDLRDVILIGHSYGGMVITGVAHQASQRLAHLVYLDALIPQNGQSLLDIVGPIWKTRFEELAKTLGDGWRCPPSPEMALASMPARMTPHPFQCFTQPLSLPNPTAARIPRTFIYCSDSGWSAEHIATHAAYARAAGWDYYELATGHMAMITDPRALAEILLEVAGEIPVP